MTNRLGAVGAGMYRTVSYADIRDQLAIGDVILCKGKAISGRWPTLSGFIRIFTGSDISHCGVVSKSARFGGAVRVSVIESTSLDGQVGVVESFLSDRIRAYNGDVYIARLREPLTPEEAREFYAFLTSQLGKKYDKAQVLLALFPFFRRRHRWDTLRWFCSELVAAAFVWIKRLAVLPKTVAPDYFETVPICHEPVRVILL